MSLVLMSAGGGAGEFSAGSLSAVPFPIADWLIPPAIFTGLSSGLKAGSRKTRPTTRRAAQRDSDSPTSRDAFRLI